MGVSFERCNILETSSRIERFYRLQQTCHLGIIHGKRGSQENQVEHEGGRRKTEGER